MRPIVGLALGDPTGIGPELVAKLIAAEDVSAHASVLLVADRDELRRGAEIAGVDILVEEVSSLERADFASPQPKLLHCELPERPVYALGGVSVEAGRYALETLKVLLNCAKTGAIDSICFAPLNKEALHRAGMAFADELHWFAEQLGYGGYVCELNVLKELWTSRVTSHVALKDVSGLITESRVLEAVQLIDRALRQAGLSRPRIAVAALNPHAGDGGAFGREEIEVLAPAVERARLEQMNVRGPYPADTLFVRALAGEFDGVVTMYHDQGQIAMKLTGFERGVSVQGGLAIPITTPAHGTAFDIAGQGKANPEAMRQAFLLACRMGVGRREDPDGRHAPAR
ncbi:MAG: 4-hydroxythreonine-4-phosphate dehydrogenase PdxA [Rhodospirillales bacterium]|nr:4-hydroxythreonine-4-phosphate dehydrogenase PdxA [Rhodospirillales bacterium]